MSASVGILCKCPVVERSSSEQHTTFNRATWNQIWWELYVDGYFSPSPTIPICTYPHPSALTSHQHPRPQLYPLKLRVCPVQIFNHDLKSKCLAAWPQELLVDSRIYDRRCVNDEILLLLLTNMNHLLFLELGDCYRKQLTPSPQYYRQLRHHYHGCCSNPAVLITLQLTSTQCA